VVEGWRLVVKGPRADNMPRAPWNVNPALTLGVMRINWITFSFHLRVSTTCFNRLPLRISNVQWTLFQENWLFLTTDIHRCISYLELMLFLKLITNDQWNQVGYTAKMLYLMLIRQLTLIRLLVLILQVQAVQDALTRLPHIKCYKRYHCVLYI
jgi:hypothetical protein